MSKKIFISHAVKDKEIADAFVDVILQGALSVSIDEIFCVSTDGTKISSGDDWRNSIKANLLSAKINFLLITPNYKESEVCMNEMGAAWMTEAIVLPLIIDPINYKTVGVIQEPTQIEKLQEEKSLDRIKDIVQEELEIENSLIKSDRWTAKKREFLLRIKKHLSENPFENPVDRLSFKQLVKDNDDLESTVNNLIQEKAELESLVNDLKNTKDKEEVSAILRNKLKSTQFDEFIALSESVKKLLGRQSSIVNGLLFRSFTGKDIKIGLEGERNEIDEALANGYIDEDLDVKWDSTKEMIKIYKALKDVSKFMDLDLKEDFYKMYDEEFDAELDINNKTFWEEIFDTNVKFN